MECLSNKKLDELYDQMQEIKRNKLVIKKKKLTLLLEREKILEVFKNNGGKSIELWERSERPERTEKIVR